MKKKVLYFLVISAIIMLIGWTQIGTAFGTPEVGAVVLVSNPQAGVPDYRLDAKFFVDWYQSDPRMVSPIRIPDYPMDGRLYNDLYPKNGSSSSQPEALDYVADAKIYFQYWKETPTRANAEIPDYPLDGKLFVEQYTARP